MLDMENRNEYKDMNWKYFKRDISWLSFNRRVLLEARNKELPLFERIKFLSIYSSNQEEFYRIRVSEHRNLVMLKNCSSAEYQNAKETLAEINAEVSRQVKDFSYIFTHEILPELAYNDIVLYQGQPMPDFHKDFIRNYFKEEIFPYLQPVLILKDHISSFLRDNRLYLSIQVHPRGSQDSQIYYALIKVPFSKVPRFIELPYYELIHYLMFVDDFIVYNLDIVFPGFVVDAYYSVRVSRDADFSIDSNQKENIVDEIRKHVKKRKTGVANRLVYNAMMPHEMLSYLCQAYNIPESQCIAAGRYLTLEDLIKLPNPTGKKLAVESPIPLRVPEFDRSGSVFKVIKSHDMLLHFPYQSFDYLIRFLMESAYDPKVEEIKLTQYRVAENSEVINALVTAARNGKKVTVYVELKARFDEENNIFTSEQMQKAGIHVIYGVPGLKVHAKVALILRRSIGGTNMEKSFAFLSTGNFNEKTAKVYSDIGLFTYNTQIITELNCLFEILEGKDVPPIFNTLLVAQYNMLDVLKSMIDQEIGAAQEGKKAYIILKMNGLQDIDMINKLYEASNAGVQIDLIILGICCLVPNQPYSHNIRIIRIIDQYLEHARIWYFYAGGNECVYLSSADWMKRNLSRRIETAFPIVDDRLKKQIIRILHYQLADNVQACQIDEHLNNIYVQNNNPERVRAQQKIYEMLQEEVALSMNYHQS